MSSPRGHSRTETPRTLIERARRWATRAAPSKEATAPAASRRRAARRRSAPGGRIMCVRMRRIGADTVGAVGFGAMQLDDPAGNAERAEATLRAALDAGVTLIDTAIAYGPGSLGADTMGRNERLVTALLDRLGVRGEVLVATKGGHVRTAGGGWAVDSSASHLRAAVEASLTNLGVEQIDLYQHHRPDPKVPYGE